MTTNTVLPVARQVTIVGGSFLYGTYAVTFAQPVNGIAAAEYPAHFVLNETGAPVNPATDDTAQLLLGAVRALTAALNTAVLQNVASLSALIATLPTTQPSTSGQLWLDGGVLALS